MNEIALKAPFDDGGGAGRRRGSSTKMCFSVKLLCSCSWTTPPRMRSSHNIVMQALFNSCYCSHNKWMVLAYHCLQSRAMKPAAWVFHSFLKFPSQNHEKNRMNNYLRLWVVQPKLSTSLIPAVILFGLSAEVSGTFIWCYFQEWPIDDQICAI